MKFWLFQIILMIETLCAAYVFGYFVSACIDFLILLKTHYRYMGLIRRGWDLTDAVLLIALVLIILIPNKATLKILLGV